MEDRRREFYVEKGSKFKRASRKLVNLQRIMKMKNEKWEGSKLRGWKRRWKCWNEQE